MEEHSKALADALLADNPEAVKRELALGADCNYIYDDELRTTVLHLASALGRSACLTELLNRNETPLFTQNAYGETPLHVSARCTHSSNSIILLVAVYGVSHSRDNDENTFLHLLMANTTTPREDFSDLLSWLLECGGAELLNVQNGDGMTVLDVASSYGRDASTLRKLAKYGAISSSSIRIRQGLEVMSEEETQRQKIATKEANKREKLLKSFTTVREFFYKIEDKLRITVEKEESRRVRIADQEREKFKNILEKGELNLNRVRQRSLNAKRKAAVGVMQKVGRGFLSRTAFRNSAAVLIQRVGRGFKSRTILYSILVVDRCERRERQEESVIEERVAESETDHQVNSISEEELLKKRAAERIYLFYLVYKRVKEMRQHRIRQDAAAVRIQANWRTYVQQMKYEMMKAACIMIQATWRLFCKKKKRYLPAVDILSSELQRFYYFKTRRLFIMDGVKEIQKSTIQETTRSITKLVWRENFCSAIKHLAFLRKGKEQHPPGALSLFQKFRAWRVNWQKITMTVQIGISLFLLIYQGCLPRNSRTAKHNNVDIAFTAVQAVLFVLIPFHSWSVIDIALIITALVCQAAKAYGGGVLVTLLLVKVPFLIRECFPSHSGTRTYCRAFRHSAFYLVMLLPFALAGVGATVRGAQKNYLLATSEGNWGNVFLKLYSTLSGQHKALYWLTNPPNRASPDPSFFPLRSHKIIVPVSSRDAFVVFEEIPIVQLIVVKAVILLYTWSAIVLGTHTAIRSHYDISDETKLKNNKRRFHHDGIELLDVHRATNMNALGQKLDGVMWEADVRAAKEAVDASHFDHTTGQTVHRFVHRVQDSVAHSGEMGQIFAKFRTKQTTTLDNRRWDCRNEDPRARGTYDIEVIEAALGIVEHKGTGERILQRQWTGQVFERESTAVLIFFLIMASVKPNLFAMEAVFSAVFVLELLLSLYFLKLDFILSHYVRLFIRIFCALVGFIPSAVPFVSFRCLRLLEGWSTIFVVPGMVRWGVLYCILTLVTLWMVAFVAALQFASDHGDQDDIICKGATDCLAISLRELVLPAWSPEHIRPTQEAPVMAVLVLIFQLFFIPFALTIVLHPLLQLSNFIGRFLRIVVQSLHKDALDYIENYLEGEDWYRRWQLKLSVSVNVGTQMKLWASDFGRKRDIFSLPIGEYAESVMSNIVLPAKVIFAGNFFSEIICKSEFASFEENRRFDRRILDFKFLNPVIKRYNNIARKPVVHLINLVLTLTSIAFIFAISSSYSRGGALVIVSTIVHLLSILSSLLIIPKDLAFIVTLVSCGSLFASVVLILLQSPKTNKFYALRFISLLRLAQLQVFPFRRARFFFKTFFNTGLNIVFPVVVVGSLSYVAELLRAQIYLVQHQKTDGSGHGFSGNWGDLSYPEQLASARRRNPAMPNLEDARNLFAYYFRQDSFIFYSIYNFWVLPALAISTFLSYLFINGANLRDTQSLTIRMIPLLEDPATMADFKMKFWYLRYFGNFVLLASLVFGCAFSPLTSITANDFNFFFGFEVAFSLVGLIEAAVATAYAVHRCRRSWAAYEFVRSDTSYKRIVGGDTFFLLCEIIQLIYYCISLPLCCSLLKEHFNCVISPGQYATYFITLRAVFLLRIMPRQYTLSFINDWIVFAAAGMTIVIYFVASASAIADFSHTAENSLPSARTWRAAFDALLRQTFTSAVPKSFAADWTAFNISHTAMQMSASNTTVLEIANDYDSYTFLFILATIGKAVVASAIGLGTAFCLIPLSTLYLSPLPPKATLLFNTLSGGMREILKQGTMKHDDLRPDFRRKLQERKFKRIFENEGIPSWSLPHLLEELAICRPNYQRRFMYVLEQLLQYLPISEDRQSKVKEYMDSYDCYCSGGPAALSFDSLPVFPPETPHNMANPLSDTAVAKPRYIQPLRLVQALAIFELGFPSDSSMGTKLWIDFFSVVQKIRGATLLQSLWRMHSEQKKFDKDQTRTFRERMLLIYLRRRFRRNRIKQDVWFRSFASFKEALRFQMCVYNPNTGHFDLLNRLQGHYETLASPIDANPKQME